MRIVPGWIVVSLLAAAPAIAATPPPPLTSDVYSFPGAIASPGSAASAGVAQADSWLGDEPFDNPAVAASGGLSLTPLLYHVSRQDLRGRNRSYSEQSAFFDGAGGWVRVGRGSLAFFAYGHQPVLRREENAYLTGPLGGSPAPVQNSATTRELHGGGGASMGRSWWRVGLAGEWVYRDDAYLTEDKSGSPLSGSSEVNFSGSAVGGQVGARVELGPEGVGHFTLGGGMRFVPELKVDGTQAASNSSGPVSATREAGYEAGVSVRWNATEQVRLVAGTGGRTAQEWQGLGLTRGGGFRWGVGVDFHDARDPWTLRFGVGQDTERGVPEPRSGAVSLGFGWKMEGTVVDVAVARHSFSHLRGATSSDDRVVMSLVFPF
ncbi:MAG: hypothetical protein ABIS67_12380 [Candidatus Eisenbacteria bacterium]